MSRRWRAARSQRGGMLVRVFQTFCEADRCREKVMVMKEELKALQLL